MIRTTPWLRRRANTSFGRSSGGFGRHEYEQDCLRWRTTLSSGSIGINNDNDDNNNNNKNQNDTIAVPLHLTNISLSWYRGFLDELITWNVKVPKGFEHFFPEEGVKSLKRGPSIDPKKDDEDSKEEKKEDSSSSSKNIASDNEKENEKKIKEVFQSFGSGSGSSKKRQKKKNEDEDPSDNEQVNGAYAAMGVAALLYLAVRAFADDLSEKQQREITWSEFRNHLLEYGDVDRIVVVNKTTAKIYCRPGAQGVPLGNYAERRLPPPPKKEMSNSTTMDFGSSSSSSSVDNESMSYENTSTSSSSLTSEERGLVYQMTIGSVESFEEKLASAQRDLGLTPREYVPVKYSTETNWAAEALRYLLPMVVLAWLVLGMRNAASGMGGFGAGGGAGGGGMSNIFRVGKSNARKIKKEDVDVTFADVAGCQEAKREIMEFVDFLQDGSRFAKLGAKIPKGALLCGPPGTGKTLLAKAVAGEANVPFYSISGSDFIEMFVGVGPSRVRDLFKEARQNSPCIVFIDEIDAVGRQRGRGGLAGGNDERENTLNQLLVEMDGFSSSTGVVVLAGTNRVDILDEALTRPGRFDRQISVDKPDLQGRKEIFLVHLKGITLEGDADEVAGRLAGLTPGFAGADIANICNEAAIQAARRKADSVAMQDFEKATDRVIGGMESHKLISKEEKNIVAHHEAGHAVAGWFLEHADPLLKVTIIPRTSGALGFAQYLPKEVFLRTQTQIMDIVCMALAGRAAEQIFFDKVTTGASDDLRRVTELVYGTIQLYGMNDKVGQLAFPKDPNALVPDKPYSDKTAQTMDEEARLVVDQAYERTLNLLRQNKAAVEAVAQLLLEKETITHDDIYDAIGPRPFQGDKNYEEYVSSRAAARMSAARKADKEQTEQEQQEQDEEDTTAPPLSPGIA